MHEVEHHLDSLFSRPVWHRNPDATHADLDQSPEDIQLFKLYYNVLNRNPDRWTHFLEFLNNNGNPNVFSELGILGVYFIGILRHIWGRYKLSQSLYEKFTGQVANSPPTFRSWHVDRTWPHELLRTLFFAPKSEFQAPVLLQDSEIPIALCSIVYFAGKQALSEPESFSSVHEQAFRRFTSILQELRRYEEGNPRQHGVPSPATGASPFSQSLGHHAATSVFFKSHSMREPDWLDKCIQLAPTPFQLFAHLSAGRSRFNYDAIEAMDGAVKHIARWTTLTPDNFMHLMTIMPFLDMRDIVLSASNQVRSRLELNPGETWDATRGPVSSASLNAIYRRQRPQWHPLWLSTFVELVKNLPFPWIKNVINGWNGHGAGRQ